MIHTYQRYDPQNIPQPHSRAAGSGLGRHGAHAVLRRPARTDRRGTGPGRPDRPQPDRRTGAQPRCADGDAAAAEGEDPGDVRNRLGSGTGRSSDTSDLAVRCGLPNSSASCSGSWSKTNRSTNLERLWYHLDDERSDFARQLVQLSAALGDKYQIDELAAKYDFTGHTPLTIPEALQIKEELESHRPAAQAAGGSGGKRTDRHHRPGGTGRSSPTRRTSSSCANWGSKIEEYIREMAEQQGLERTARWVSADSASRTGCSRAGCWSGSSATCRRHAPVATRGRSSAKALSSCSRPTLRVRRLGRQHGCGRLDDQRHGPPGRAAARPDAINRISRSTARATRPSVRPS